MGIFEKIKFQFNTEQQKANYSHLRNLFLVAYADGRMDNLEFEFILSVADKLYIDRSMVREIHSSLNDIPFKVPMREKQKLDQVYDLITLSLIDGDIDNREVLTCKNIFIQYGYRPVLFEIVLNSILNSLERKLIKETVVNNLIKSQTLNN